MSRTAKQRRDKLAKARRAALAKPPAAIAAAGEPAREPIPTAELNPFAAAHGDYVPCAVVDLVSGRTPGIGEHRPRVTETGRALRNRSSDLKRRLGRYRALDAGQVAAALRFEADHQLARLEPRMVTDLTGFARGAATDLPERVLDARDRVQAARTALRRAGQETARVVEAVILDGETSTGAARPRYADPVKGQAHVAALLDAGLWLLAEAYRPQRPPPEIPR